MSKVTRVPSWNDDASYWRLVQQLMLLGWYRVGPGPAQDPDGMTWGFREGHLIDVNVGQTVWIAAPDEQSAMEVLMRELQGPSGRSMPEVLRGLVLR